MILKQFQPLRPLLTGLWLIFGNKTDVGLSDNFVQLIKAHSLHTLFAVFEKNRNFQKIGKFRFSQKQQTMCANCASWWAEQNCDLGQHQFYFPKLAKVLSTAVGVDGIVFKIIIFDKMAVSQRWKIKIQPKCYPTFSWIF